MARIAIKAIVPKRLFSMNEFQEEIISAMKSKTKSLIKADYDQTVAGWTDKPMFPGTVRATPSFIRLLVKPTGPNTEKYNLVVMGSPPHIIAPKTPAGLRFRRGPYRAATTPGRLSSRRASRSGPLRRTFTPVRHPGFKPRAFYDLIAANQEARFIADMQVAMAKGAARLNRNMK